MDRPEQSNKITRFGLCNEGEDNKFTFFLQVYSTNVRGYYPFEMSDFSGTELTKVLRLWETNKGHSWITACCAQMLAGGTFAGTPLEKWFLARHYAQMS